MWYALHLALQDGWEDFCPIVSLYWSRRLYAAGAARAWANQVLEIYINLC